MILSFSGTGNSAYVAKKLAAALDDEVLDLFERLRNHDHSPIRSDKPWVLVCPTYAWRIPHVVEDLLRDTPLLGASELYVVMTCGGSIGNAGAYLKRLALVLDKDFKGVAEVVMPENYLAMFPTPTDEEAARIIEAAQEPIARVAELIAEGSPLPPKKVGIKDRLNSGPTNAVFYPLFVHDKKFYATDACVSCGLCERVCPLGNIALKGGRPTWHGTCTHCMACICHCPKQAIEYGKHSQGLPRYTFPKTQ